MKLEEAIRILRGMENTTGNANITKEPLQMAIKALENQAIYHEALILACEEICNDTSIEDDCPNVLYNNALPECASCNYCEGTSEGTNILKCWEQYFIIKAKGI